MCSPTGSPLADAIPSSGLRRLLGWRDEKKSAPIDNGDVLVVNGEARENSFVVVNEVCGWESMCSYMSRSRLKSVGKKISKYPCLTSSVVQGTVVFL